MGRFTTRALEEDEYRKIILLLRTGYEYKGIKHRPNDKIATILVLQANLGCRIGDIVTFNDGVELVSYNHFYFDDLFNLILGFAGTDLAGLDLDGIFEDIKIFDVFDATAEPRCEADRARRSVQEQSKEQESTRSSPKRPASERCRVYQAG